MGKPEEYEIEQEPREVITGHFQKTIRDVELAKSLSRFYELKTEIDILTERMNEIGKELKAAGKGVESLMAGDYAAFFTKVSGIVKTDWAQAYRDAVGEMPPEDVSKYVKKSEGHIKMEVKKIR